MRRFFAWLERYPIQSFCILLVLLMGIIALSSWSRSPQAIQESGATDPKTSPVFPVGEAGFVMATAQIKKSDVIDVVATTGGMVQSVKVAVGQKVVPGTVLAHLTNDYGAENGRLVARKAAIQSDLTKRIYSLQKDILERERRITQNDDTITKRQEENAVKNIKIEIERLRVNRELASIDAAIANASDTVFNPKSIFAGSVEYIGVRPGETVSAGSLIATIRGTTDTTTLVATLPDRIAHVISPNGSATLITDTEAIPLTQGYLAQGENTLGLRSITFPLEKTVAHQFTNSEFVDIFLPLVNPADGFFVPIDAVLSGARGTSVLVLEGEHQVGERAVETGPVVGSFVLVTSGLQAGDTLLTNRDLVPGETVQTVR